MIRAIISAGLALFVAPPRQAHERISPVPAYRQRVYIIVLIAPFLIRLPTTPPENRIGRTIIPGS
jgi:hypothetical protein